jgi:hypothetical protein
MEKKPCHCRVEGITAGMTQRERTGIERTRARELREEFCNVRR